MYAYSDEEEIDMSKTLESRAWRRRHRIVRAGGNRVGSQCRAQAYSMWQQGRNGDGLDLQREFIVNSCMANGGHL